MKKILIIDDSQEVNYFLKMSLEADGFNVVTATTGQEAIKNVKSFMPDLIILDVIMPLLNGYEVCRVLKIDEQTRNIPIILISGKKLDMDNLEKALQIWVDRFLHKPIEMIELKRLVYELLGENSADILNRVRVIDAKFNATVDAYKKLVRSMDGLFTKFARNENIDFSEIYPICSEFLDVFITDHEILYNLMNSYIIDSPSALHSVNTALISLCIAQCFTFSRAAFSGLCAVALTHEFGIKDDAIISKFGLTNISAKEKEQFKPIIRIADKFETLTSIRVNQPPLPPMMAIKQITDDKSAGYDQNIVKNLLTCVSPYPIGSFVKLNTGEIAKVKKINPQNPFRPVVEVVMDRFANIMLEPRELDLAQDLQVFIFRNVLRDEVYNTVMKFAKNGSK